MLKKVRIKIVTDRVESKGSLFEGSGVTARKKGAEPEHLELVLEGRYHDDGVRVSIGYTEGEMSGMEGSKTTISYQKNEPALVTMMRTGTVKTALVFERGRRHHCVYQTPIMPFEVAVHTAEVQNALESEGRLVLDYTVELKGAAAEHTHLVLTLLPAFDHP